jgi:hypothetical protein
MDDIQAELERERAQEKAAKRAEEAELERQKTLPEKEQRALTNAFYAEQKRSLLSEKAHHMEKVWSHFSIHERVRCTVAYDTLREIEKERTKDFDAYLKKQDDLLATLPRDICEYVLWKRTLEGDAEEAREEQQIKTSLALDDLLGTPKERRKKQVRGRWITAGIGALLFLYLWLQNVLIYGASSHQALRDAFILAALFIVIREVYGHWKRAQFERELILAELVKLRTGIDRWPLV